MVSGGWQRTTEMTDEPASTFSSGPMVDADREELLEDVSPEFQTARHSEMNRRRADRADRVIGV
jgi:hypothetical protein